MSELMLGTAQLGLDYGLTNDLGRPDDGKVQALATTASALGISKLDTAAAYGDSLSRIGKFFSDAKFEVISKFHTANGSLREKLKYQENLLLRKKLYGLLFHDAQELFTVEGELQLEELRDLKAAGQISKIGISIYDEIQLKKVLEIFPDMDLVQLPANALDLDLLNSATLNSIVDSGVEVHVRSVLLQGLLLCETDQLEPFFMDIKPLIHQLDVISDENGMSRLETILSIIKNHRNVSGVIIGTGSSDEIIELNNAWNSCKKINIEIASKEVKHLLDPRVWPKRK